MKTIIEETSENTLKCVNIELCDGRKFCVLALTRDLYPNSHGSVLTPSGNYHVITSRDLELGVVKTTLQQTLMKLQECETQNKSFFENDALIQEAINFCTSFTKH